MTKLGRPFLTNEPSIRVSVLLPKILADLALAIGCGEKSRGIRMALQHWQDTRPVQFIRKEEKMKTVITNRFTNEKIGEFDISPKAYLSEADLRWANLSGANLSEADLSGAKW